MSLRRMRELRRRLGGRTVRARLTLVYGALFLASGAVLLVITGVLWGRATRDQNAVINAVSGRIFNIVVPPGEIPRAPFSRLAPGRGTIDLARRPPREQVRAVGAQLQRVAVAQRSNDLHQLLFYSGIALGITALVALVLGWLIAGRVLRPLRTITSTAQDISATNLHERLDLGGPDDELRRLGDTIDELLGRLERSFEAQRQFVANASHELRTPLTTMRASIDVALAKPGPVPEQTQVLADRLAPELDQIDRLLEGFLVLARAQRGLSSSEEEMPLEELVDHALDERAGAIATRALSLERDRGAGATVAGSEILLMRLVGNLIDNAIRHNERGGFVRVATPRSGDRVRLVVENGGPVLDDEAVRDLVQPFTRLGAQRTASGEGFGLGLSIVAAIAEAHGGHLELHARAGGGLRALVELPVAARALSRARA